MRTAFGREYLYQKSAAAFFQGLIDRVGFSLFKKRVPQPETNKVRKILVSRIDHLGDVFIASSIVPHLKRAYPDAEVHFLAGEWARICLDRNPDVARVHVYNSLKQNRSGHNPVSKLADAFFGFIRTVRALRAERYDISIDLRAYAFNSIPLLWLGRAGFKVGFSTGGFGFFLDRVVPYRLGVHESRHVSDALDALGIIDPDRVLKPEYIPPEAARDECTDMLSYLGVGPEGYVLLHTGAGTPVKRWKKERWQELIDKLGPAYGADVLVFDTFYGDLNGCKKLDSLISFDVFSEIERRAKLFVGLDSFPAHLAASFSTPVVVVWCGVNDQVQWAPVGPRVEIVRRELDCSPCLMKDGCSGMECMDISADDCLEAAARLVKPRRDTDAAQGE